jgi:nicotinamidase-related amidase
MPGALIIVDLQTGLFQPAPPPAGAHEMIGRINMLAARARARNIPVIIVQHERPRTGLEYDSAGWQLDRRLTVTPEDVRLRKTSPDSFHHTALQEILTAWGVNHVAICGYASEFCVDTTVRRAAALGFAVTLVSDGHTTHDKAHLSAAQITAHHNATLPDITSFGPEIRLAPAATLWTA